MSQGIQGHIGIAQINGAEINLGQALAAASVPVVLPAIQAAALAPATPKTIKTASGSFAADADLVAAVTGKRIKVTGFNFFTFGTSATTIIFKSNGAAGAEQWRICLQSVASQVMGLQEHVPAPAFIFATLAGEKLTADTNTGDTVHWSLTYYDDDAT